MSFYVNNNKICTNVLFIRIKRKSGCGIDRLIEIVSKIAYALKNNIINNLLWK